VSFAALVLIRGMADVSFGAIGTVTTRMVVSAQRVC
jgi:hypothetical protein